MRAWILAGGFVVIFSAACGHSRSNGNPAGPSPAPVRVPAAPVSVTVTGTIVEIGGGPVAGATIQVQQQSVETVSDESGVFTLTVTFAENAGGVSFRVSKNGYEPSLAQFQGPIMRIQLQRQRQITGRVLDTEGVALADVDVFGSGTPYTKSDADGSFVATAGSTLGLRKDGFVGRSIGLKPGQDVALGDVRMQRSITISGPSHLSFVLSESDPEQLTFDDYDCSPCKWIDVVTGGHALQVDIHVSAAGPFDVAFKEDYYRNTTRTRIGPGDRNLRLQLPSGTIALLIGLAATPGVPVPLAQPATFDLDVTAP